MRKLIAILAFLALAINGFGQEKTLTSQEFEALYPSTEQSVTPYHNDWTIRHYSDRIKVFKAAPLHKGDIVFIGNSITEQGRDWSDKFGIKHISNRGIAGDLTDGVLQRLDEIIYCEPKAIFILIGVNDLFNIHHDMDTKHHFVYEKIVPSPKFVAKNILKITKQLTKALPNTKIYVRTVLPTRRDYLQSDILEVNSFIRKYEKKGFFTLVDLYSQFVDKDGKMNEELTRDGVHLNDAGYAKWVAFEKPIIEGL